MVAWRGTDSTLFLEAATTIDVSAVALDDFIANGGPIPQLVKIDVEGVASNEVLRWRRTKPLFLATTTHRR